MSYRVSCDRAALSMVNDNVRYAGAEVPVDLILSDFANSFGLEIDHIWTLPRQRQQQPTDGLARPIRLRKCVYVWRKPR